ncbi:hypothetical protein [Sphingobium yanoikuyae]
MDYQTVELGEYFEALEAHNSEAGGDRQKAPADLDRLRRFVDAHRG